MKGVKKHKFRPACVYIIYIFIYDTYVYVYIYIYMYILFVSKHMN